MAAESANGQQKEAARQLQRSQDAAAEARSEAQEVGMQLKLEKERAHIAEQRRKAAMLDKEDLENRLATLHREAQSKVEHDADVHQVSSLTLEDTHRTYLKCILSSLNRYMWYKTPAFQELLTRHCVVQWLSY